MASAESGDTAKKMVYPQNEICNNIDDDCNGETDEDVTRPCGNSPFIRRMQERHPEMH